VEVRELDFNDFLEGKALSRREVQEAKERFGDAVGRAISHLRQAKGIHDRLESYYTPAMDFKAVEAKKEEIRARIQNCI